MTSVGRGAVAVGDIKECSVCTLPERIVGTNQLETDTRILSHHSAGLSNMSSLASVGEGGSLCVCDMRRSTQTTMRKYEEIDSCSLNDVMFLRDSGNRLLWTADRILVHNCNSGTFELRRLRGARDVPVTVGKRCGLACISQLHCTTSK